MSNNGGNKDKDRMNLKCSNLRIDSVLAHFENEALMNMMMMIMLIIIFG